MKKVLPPNFSVKSLLQHITIFCFRQCVQYVWIDWRIWYFYVAMEPVRCVETECRNARYAEKLSNEGSYYIEIFPLISQCPTYIKIEISSYIFLPWIEKKYIILLTTSSKIQTGFLTIRFCDWLTKYDYRNITLHDSIWNRLG